VEVDEGDYDKRTALHLAASEGHVDLMNLLLDTYCADVNVVDRYNGTPMIDAVRHKQDTSAAILRTHGAILKLEDPAGALCSAAAEGDVEEVRAGLGSSARPALSHTQTQHTPLSVCVVRRPCSTVSWWDVRADLSQRWVWTRVNRRMCGLQAGRVTKVS